MKIKRKNRWLAVILSTLLMMSLTGIAEGGDVAITNATIVTVSGETIENGTLIIAGDKIHDLGQNVSIPAGMEVIDATGLFVYPGMIDCATGLGLYEVGAVAATVDAREMGTYNAHIQASVAINAYTVHIPLTRVNGITAALVVPGGGVITGQSALINLNGWTPAEMIVKAPAAIHVEFPRLPREDGRRRRGQQQETGAKGKERTEKQIGELIQVFHNAKRYADTWDAYKAAPKAPAPATDLMLEAMVPVIKGELPVIISVDVEKDIANAIEFVDSMKVKAIFAGVNQGWKVAPLLAKKKIPVIVGSVLRSPGSKDPYDANYANAAALHKAGVKLAFMTQSAPDVRSLPYHAGTAAAFGLPKEAALKALTINAAEILGAGDLMGSLEKGKLANVIITDGDPLEMRTNVKQVFIAGEKIPMTSKHVELYEKFRKRPPVKKE